MALILTGSLVVLTLVSELFLHSTLPWRERGELLLDALMVLVFLAGIGQSKPQWVHRSPTVGFALLTLTGVSALVITAEYLLAGRFPARLNAPGVFNNPIQCGTVFLILTAFSILWIGAGARWTQKTTNLVLLTLALIGILIFLTRSRGALLAYAIYLVVLVVALPKGQRLGYILKVLGVLAVSAMLYQLATGHLDDIVNNMIARGDSKRFLIWEAVLSHPPGNLWLGHGIAAEFPNTAAGQAIKENYGITINHSHNLFMRAYYQVGLVGLALLLMIFGLIIRNLQRLDAPARNRLSVFLVAFVCVHLTDTARLITAPKQDWFLLWLPLGFLAILSAGEDGKTSKTQEPNERLSAINNNGWSDRSAKN